MRFEIVPRRDLSLADLRRLHDQGEHVLKTPHVGNHYPNNLAVAALGIPLMCVDRTIGVRDRNFHPHRVIHKGKAVDIANPHRIVTHVRVTHEHPHFGERFPRGGSVLEGHMQALKDALPHASIRTEAENLTMLGERIFDFLEALTRVHPAMWRRFVRADGSVVEPGRPLSWEQVRREGIHDVELRDGTGWIIPNEWCILWDAVGAAQGGKSEVYELSGPDMIRYINTVAQEIERAYTIVHDTVPGLRLPERMVFNIVPVAAMRFAVAEGKRQALDHLIEAYVRFTRLRREWSAGIQALSRAERSVEITRVAKERRRENDCVREAVRGIPEIFYEIEQANFLSQYDLLTGEQLYIHPFGIDTPIAEVEEAMKWFAHLHSAD